MNRPVMPTSRLIFRGILPMTLLLAACGGGEPAQPGPLEGSALTGDYALVNAAGEPVTDESFAGSWQMVYFGYAYCPDVCPFDVQRMVQGYNLFAADNPDLADAVQPIFITVDPERDTPEVVGEFTASFSDRLIGLTGTPEQIEAAAEAFFVAYEKLPETADGEYLMSHTNAAYLLDREGDPIALLPVDSSAAEVAAELEKWVS
jgi:protein SCO1/2